MSGISSYTHHPPPYPQHSHDDHHNQHQQHDPPKSSYKSLQYESEPKHQFHQQKQSNHTQPIDSFQNHPYSHQSEYNPHYLMPIPYSSRSGLDQQVGYSPVKTYFSPPHAIPSSKFGNQKQYDTAALSAFDREKMTATFSENPGQESRLVADKQGGKLVQVKREVEWGGAAASGRNKPSTSNGSDVEERETINTLNLTTQYRNSKQGSSPARLTSRHSHNLNHSSRAHSHNHPSSREYSEKNPSQQGLDCLKSIHYNYSATPTPVQSMMPSTVSPHSTQPSGQGPAVSHPAPSSTCTRETQATEEAALPPSAATAATREPSLQIQTRARTLAHQKQNPVQDAGHISPSQTDSVCAAASNPQSNSHHTSSSTCSSSIDPHSQRRYSLLVQPPFVHSNPVYPANYQHATTTSPSPAESLIHLSHGRQSMNGVATHSSHPYYKYPSSHSYPHGHASHPYIHSLPNAHTQYSQPQHHPSAPYYGYHNSGPAIPPAEHYSHPHTHSLTPHAYRFAVGLESDGNTKRRARSITIEEEGEDLLAKRRKNTEAARRSRLRKSLKLESLEEQRRDLEAEKHKLSIRAVTLESENKTLALKLLQAEECNQTLQQQLDEAHKTIVRMQLEQNSMEIDKSSAVDVHANALVVAASVPDGIATMSDSEDTKSISTIESNVGSS
ncbi:hypothetical protein BATDEDRAFT_23600 [Batrachochytrium dendrobatidis JAM81]|uniref:BZIP domain-containing protein n=1 Tax=Batrachochytrium dendrobatidis (strain JAM81 / FGSC 10211) TaxID=684364 RepID=F4NXT2_BATDJ|nr:uncharacterized protein BATDEDRAFT_23600 [Batrachochytrium dendrobatidis JAM81]EGF82195.1 hypothetical protein BATDEDRAFT_23600 [Batrachochytrium dendrobatidis JAM81]|eukprot:XP_006677327.1 hypothetical protein BATDEDRAFT_23600 [Batrachochytrium dendrobatidis JAM81]